MITISGLALASLLVGAGAVAAADLTVNTSDALVGQDSASGIKFSSRRLGTASVAVEVQLGDKRITAHVDYERQRLRVSSRSAGVSGPVVLTAQDVAQVRGLLVSLSPGSSQVGDALMSLLTWLADFPPGQPIEFQGAPRSGAGPTITSLCDEIGETIPGHYTANGQTVTEEAVLGPCGVADSNDCLGRCGAGCQSNPGDPAAAQRFTQECFNHDLCARGTGKNLGPCLAEFVAASPGYFFAPDCAAITGSYTLAETGTVCADGQCNSLSELLAPESLQFASRSLAFSGVSAPSAIDGRRAKFQGIRTGLNAIAGAWRIPTYAGECGDLFLGYAEGSFTGQNMCAKSFTMNLAGTYPFYTVPQCTFAGEGILQDDALSTADQDSPDAQMDIVAAPTPASAARLR